MAIEWDSRACDSAVLRLLGQVRVGGFHPRTFICFHSQTCLFVPLPHFTESQNGQGWKGLLWVIQFNPPAEAGQQAAQDLVQAGLKYLQRRKLHNLPGQPVPVLCHPSRGRWEEERVLG